jgi:tRNA pseudouridine13 synthase
MEELFRQPPLLTAELPGIGGRIKAMPEDFEVEEIPAYEPCGAGDHLYLWVEKRGMGAEYFSRQVAYRLGVSASAVGMAGLKDRHAVTRQWISVPTEAEARLAQLEGDGVRLLRVSRHTNKLKAGHLHGNRFRILVRDVLPEAQQEDRLTLILDALRRHGLPNFYGPQRFGHDFETLRLGLALLRGETPPPSPTGRRHNFNNAFFRKLILSAAQAGLFNAYLQRRLGDGLLRRVLPGDVMAKRPFGGLFVVADPPREQERFDARETVTTGPIFGRKTFPAAGEADDREAAILTDAGLDGTAFTRFGKLVQGTRRHNLVYVDDLQASIEPEGMRLTFTLPAGSYATVLLHEVMKNDAQDRDEDGDA